MSFPFIDCQWVFCASGSATDGDVLVYNAFQSLFYHARTDPYVHIKAFNQTGPLEAMDREGSNSTSVLPQEGKTKINDTPFAVAVAACYRMG